ncbi:hypothetical protein GUJ93_ZPchr0013g37643 [Zizania palustris]|uniref:Uncharacterized protein n=1 Tax=Zizania palustris TaxID=103762 RepID=A0A8J6C2B5_ZIZPA|nr:hypothetical protein GUJ93_ZPchr0013g37643 [Zizania palustris]
MHNATPKAPFNGVPVLSQFDAKSITQSRRQPIGEPKNRGTRNAKAVGREEGGDSSQTWLSPGEPSARISPADVTGQRPRLSPTALDYRAPNPARKKPALPWRLPWSAPAAAVRRQWLSASPPAAPSPKRRAPDTPTADYHRSPGPRAASGRRPSAERPSGRARGPRLRVSERPYARPATGERPTGDCVEPSRTLEQYSENQSNASSNDSLFWTLVMF